jgi:hypothetical protein
MRVASWSLLAALIIGPVAGAQISQPDTPRNRPTAGPESPLPQTPDSAFSATVFAAMPKFGGPPVKGLPFSATETIVREQTLADGTTIKTRIEVLLWRDAEGRMRGESALKPHDSQMQGRTVTLMDPVERTFMCWISENQYGHVVAVAHLPDLNTPPPPPPPGVTSPSQQGTVHAFTQPGRMPHALAQSSANVHTEALPTDNIAGLYVEGTRTTKVIPAGAEGNDREITVTSETWTSPDLKITARQMTDDPRTGKVTTELTNIERSDPAPSLFKAPEGYTVMEMPRMPTALPAALP